MRKENSLEKNDVKNNLKTELNHKHSFYGYCYNFYSNPFQTATYMVLFNPNVPQNRNTYDKSF